MTTKKTKLPKPVKVWTDADCLRLGKWLDVELIKRGWRVYNPKTRATVELAKVRQVLARFFTTQSTTTERLAIQEALQMLALDKVPRYDPQDVATKPAKAKPARKGKKGTVAK